MLVVRQFGCHDIHEEKAGRVWGCHAAYRGAVVPHEERPRAWFTADRGFIRRADKWHRWDHKRSLGYVRGHECNDQFVLHRGSQDRNRREQWLAVGPDSATNRGRHLVAS